MSDPRPLQERIEALARYEVSRLDDMLLAVDPGRCVDDGQLVHLADVLALLAEAVAPQPEPWQPIATAPKDGRYVLLRLDRFAAGVAIGKWFDFDQTIHGVTGFWEAHAMEVTPTGWAPLPSSDPQKASPPEDWWEVYDWCRDIQKLAQKVSERVDRFANEIPDPPKGPKA